METKKKATAAAEAARHERLRALTLAEHGRKQADQHQKKAVAARQAASASESMVTMLTERIARLGMEGEEAVFRQVRERQIEKVASFPSSSASPPKRERAQQHLFVSHTTPFLDGGEEQYAHARWEYRVRASLLVIDVAAWNGWSSWGLQPKQPALLSLV